jgi:hypothetical protein
VGFRPAEKRKGKRSASGPHTMTTAVGYAGLGPAEKYEGDAARAFRHTPTTHTR